jgi:hypothetical protein
MRKGNIYGGERLADKTSKQTAYLRAQVNVSPPSLPPSLPASPFLPKDSDRAGVIDKISLFPMDEAIDHFLG